MVIAYNFIVDSALCALGSGKPRAILKVF